MLFSTQEFIDEYLKSIFPNPKNRKRPRVYVPKEGFSKEERRQRPKSLTNSFAMKFNKGKSILVASDRRLLSGLTLSADDEVKISQISPFSAFTCSGDVTAGGSLLEDLKNFIELFYEKYERTLSPDGQAGYLSSLLKDLSEYFYEYPYYYAEPILAAFDPELQKARLFIFYDAAPFYVYYKERDFGGIGCGYPYIKTILEENYRKEMKQTDAVKLAILAMYHSGKQSAGVTDIRVACPIIAIIDKNGFRFLSDAQIKRYANTALKNREGVVIKKATRKRRR